MPDAYARITELDDATVAQLADAMELRATDPVQLGFVDAYLADVRLLDARVLEVGCGTGAIARHLVSQPGVATVLGIDPSPLLLDRARALSGELANLSFKVGDGRDLPVEDGCFDVVVLHTVLSHIPGPETVLREAYRTLAGGGTLAVFDGDYSTITFANGEDDPLEACAAEFRRSYINDAWVMRRAVAMMLATGFQEPRLRSYGYAQVHDANYMLSVLGRGADAIVGRGLIAAELAEALKREGHRRVTERSFFGHIAYLSVVATKP
jgi:ubiquinone/menaquinone biosynthesis C-methylase UbiE